MKSLIRSIIIVALISGFAYAEEKYLPRCAELVGIITQDRARSQLGLATALVKLKKKDVEIAKLKSELEEKNDTDEIQTPPQ